MSDFQVGDKVLVTIEGHVGYVSPTGVDVYSKPGKEGGLLAASGWPRVHSIEKIEPDPILPAGLTISDDGNLLNWRGENYVRQQPVDEPVEVFKPGDVVRMKGWRGPGGHVHLGVDGYINECGRVYKRDRSWMDKEFTSEGYEKVDL